MFVRSSCITLLTAVVALAGTAGASAALKTGPAGTASPVRQQVSRAMKVVKTKGSVPVRPVLPGGTTVVAITAFPAGGKGSGTEATCGLWSDRLQEDEQALDDATDKQDIIDATQALSKDVDNALDAGCAVIYSAAKRQFASVKTVAIARLSSGRFTKSTWSAGTAVAMISAFPTGGKGSGTEATCALWSQRLQDDQQIIDNAPEADKDDASGPLTEDIDNALDAGCAVIY